jgi:hypothetical protein
MQQKMPIDGGDGPPPLSLAAGPPAGALAVDLEWVKAEAAGFLVYGGPGSGKSHLLRFLLEETHGRVHQVVIDSEGEFWTLRERFDYLIAGGDGTGAPRSMHGDGSDLPLSVATAGVLCQRVMEVGVSLIADLSGMRVEDRPLWVAAFLGELLATPRALWHPVLVVVDEAHLYAPQSGDSPAKSALLNLPAIGRKRGMVPVFATQNVEQIDKGAISNLRNKVVGTIAMDIRRKRAADDLGLSREDAARLKAMRRGEFFVQGPAFAPALGGAGEVAVVSVPDTLTHRPPVGLLGAAAAAPPTSDSLRALLQGHFAALSAEAEGQAATLEGANARIAALEQALKEAREQQGEPRPAAAARVPAQVSLPGMAATVPPAVRTVVRVIERPFVVPYPVEVISAETLAAIREVTGVAAGLDKGVGKLLAVLEPLAALDDDPAEGAPDPVLANVVPDANAPSQRYRDEPGDDRGDTPEVPAIEEKPGAAPMPEPPGTERGAPVPAPPSSAFLALPAGAQRLLMVLAAWRGAPVRRRTALRLAGLSTAVEPGSGALSRNTRRAIYALRDQGWAEFGGAGLDASDAVTPAGLAAVGVSDPRGRPQEAVTLHLVALWTSRLGGTQSLAVRTLRALVEARLEGYGPVSRLELAARVGQKVSSREFVAALRALLDEGDELVTADGALLCAADALFPADPGHGDGGNT